MKTIVERGVGYDRPFDLCEIVIDMKVYTKTEGKEFVYLEYLDLHTFMTDKEKITPIIKKIINSMKKQERVSCLIKPSYLQQIDPSLIQQYNIDLNSPIYIDVFLKDLTRIDDIYKDGTTFHKTLQKGVYTASPYRDSLVACNCLS